MLGHSPRAPVNPSHPEPWRICDRCGFRWIIHLTQWQHDWRGNELANIRLIVCPRCLDTPQPSGRKPIRIGPDPVPVKDPRPGYAISQMGGIAPGVDSPPIEPVPRVPVIFVPEDSSDTGA
jgi:hypothetical protein